MSKMRFLIVLAMVGVIGFSAQQSDGALAAAAGGSGLSGKLAKNKAIRKQQLIADPDEPTSGSISVSYNPGIVTLSGLMFGPGYTGSGVVEIDNGDGVSLVDINGYIAKPFGAETGYVQVFFSEPTQNPSFIPPAHGEMAVAPGYTTIDSDGPVAVDTHGLFFDYLDIPDSTVAEYTIFASSGNRPSGNQADFLRGMNETGAYTIQHGDIASATVRGSLDTVPLPPAALVGGMTMLGTVVIGRIRRRRIAE